MKDNNNKSEKKTNSNGSIGYGKFVFNMQKVALKNDLNFWKDNSVKKNYIRSAKEYTKWALKHPKENFKLALKLQKIALNKKYRTKLSNTLNDAFDKKGNKILESNISSNDFATLGEKSIDEIVDDPKLAMRATFMIITDNYY